MSKHHVPGVTYGLTHLERRQSAEFANRLDRMAHRSPAAIAADEASDVTKRFQHRQPLATVAGEADAPATSDLWMTGAGAARPEGGSK